VLDKCLEETPDNTVPYNYFMVNIAALYYRAAGDYRTTDSSKVDPALAAKGNAIMKRLSEIYTNNLDYYLSLQNSKYYKLVDMDRNQSLYILQAVTNILQQTSQKSLYEEVNKKFMDYAQRAGG
jgi:hypothetical protein